MSFEKRIFFKYLFSGQGHPSRSTIYDLSNILTEEELAGASTLCQTVQAVAVDKSRGKGHGTQVSLDARYARLGETWANYQDVVQLATSVASHCLALDTNATDGARKMAFDLFK